MTSPAMVIYAVVGLALASPGAHAAEPNESPEQLIKDLVYNELVDHRQHGFFEYLDAKSAGQQIVVKAEVETRAGRVNRVLSTDGRPLTPEEESQSRSGSAPCCATRTSSRSCSAIIRPTKIASPGSSLSCRMVSFIN